MKNGKLELTVYMNEPWLRGFVACSKMNWRPMKKGLRQHIQESVSEGDVGLDIIFTDEVCGPDDILVTVFHDSDGAMVADSMAKSKYGVRVASGLRRRVAATVNEFLYNS